MKRLSILFMAVTVLLGTLPVSAEASLKPYMMTKPAAQKQSTTAQPIADFESGLPETSEMQLTIKSFPNISGSKVRESVELLYAKGFLPSPVESDYNGNKVVSAEQFSQLLCKAFHLDTPVWESVQTLNRAAASVMISSGMEYYRKMYHLAEQQQKRYQTQYSDLKETEDEQILAAAGNVLKAGLLAPKSDTVFGLDQPLTCAEAVVMVADMLLKTDLIGLGKGADMPFTEYETEYCESNGENIVSSSFVDGFAYEALGRSVTKLSSAGDYIKFENLPECDRIFIRYSIPNPELALDEKGNVVGDGSYYCASIGVYANGEKHGDVDLTARTLFGQRDTTRGAGQYNKKYYNMAHITDISIPEGGSFMLRKDAGNNAEAYYIDSVFFEKAPPQVEKPEGFLDIRDYGAVPDDNYDDTEAIARCVYDAEYSSKGVYIPAGEFLMTEMVFVGANVTIQGAGMHYTTIHCNKYAKGYWQFGGRGSFGLFGDNITVRDLRFFNSAHPTRGGARSGAIPLTGRVSSKNMLFENLLIENTECASWMTTSDSVFRNIRIWHTFADGIHFTNDSKNNIVENCYALGLGDDAIAITGDGPPTLSHDMVWKNNTVRQIYWGRGIMLSGCYGITVENNLVTDTCHGSGLQIWTESSYDSYSSYEITARNNVFLRCGTHNMQEAAVSVINKHTGFYADADLYDNEIYETLGVDAMGFYEHSGKLYAETANNIIQKPVAAGYSAIGRPVPREDSEIHNGTDLILSSAK